MLIKTHNIKGNWREKIARSEYLKEFHKNSKNHPVFGKRRDKFNKEQFDKNYNKIIWDSKETQRES